MLNHIFQYKNTVLEEYCVRGPPHLYSGGVWVGGKEGEEAFVITPEALSCTFPQQHPKPSLPTLIWGTCELFPTGQPSLSYGPGMFRALPEISLPCPSSITVRRNGFETSVVAFWVWRITYFKSPVVVQSYSVLGGLASSNTDLLLKVHARSWAELPFILTPAGLKWIIIHWLHGL